MCNLIVKTLDINAVRSNRLYLKFTSSCCKDLGIRIFGFVTKTQKLYNYLEWIELKPALYMFWPGLVGLRKPNYSSSKY